MSEPVWIQCPHCEKQLKLKNRNVVGKKVPCPKCSVPFRIEVPPESEAELEVFDEDFDSLNHDDEYASNEAVPIDDDLDEFDDEYESTPRRSSAAKSRGKQSSDSKGVVIAASVGGGLLVIGLAVGVYFLTSRNGVDRSNAVVVAQATPNSEVDAEAADAPPPEPTFAQDNAETAPAANTAEEPPAQPAAQPDGSPAQAVPAGEVQLSEAQLEALREKMRKNPGAMKEALKRRRRKIHEAQKALPADKQATPPTDNNAEQVSTPVAVAAGETAQDQTTTPAAETPPSQPAPEGTPQPVALTTNAPPTATTQPESDAAQVVEEAPAVNPEDAARTALKDLGGRVELNTDRVVEAVTLTKMEDLTDDDLEHLRAFSQLKRLDLSYTPITDDGLVHLVELEHLTGLNLSGTKITNDGLQLLTGFKNLKALGLRDTSVSSRGIAAISELHSLEQLFIGGSKIRAAGIKKLTEALPDCAVER